MLAIDHQNRLDCLDPLHSVCVTAPAGSGKTELLIQRILVLLARVNNPEEILAITFTRKAASEVHQRILGALDLAQSSDEPEEEHKRLTWNLARKAIDRNDECGWHLLENPGRIRIQTIDGFCASLTRQMPIVSKFGTQPKIATVADKYYRLAVRALLSSLEREGAIADSLSTLISHLDNNMGRVEDLLVAMLERRDQWLVHIVFSGYEKEVRAGLEATAKAVIDNTLTTITDLLKPYAPELVPLLDYAGGNLLVQADDLMAASLAGITELPPNELDSLDLWLSIADILLTNKNQWRKSFTVKNGFPTKTIDGDKTLAKQRKDSMLSLLGELSSNESLLEALTELRFLPSDKFSTEQWELLESLSILLPVLTAELQTIFQHYAEVDYIQVSVAALESLGGVKMPSELLMKLDYQLKHILVDEFQDTATSQFELLKKLVEGWEEHNHINPNSPKTLFIVGDGMQSIYGFRAANVGLFLEARSYGVNGLQLKNLPLAVNFRSRPALVKWINQTFENSFPRADNISRGAVKYAYSSAFKAEAVDNEVVINAFHGGDSELQEAAYIANLICDLQASDPHQTIAILVRSRSHLREILPALKRAGLNWEANDIDPLAQYPFISDLLILTRALSNIQDRIAWAAFLRSPFCGISNNDMHILLGEGYSTVWAAMNNSASVVKISTYAKDRLSYVCEVMRLAIDDRLRRPFRVWVEGVWLKLGGASLLDKLDQFDHVDDYFNLLEESETHSGLRFIDEFEASVHKLYASSASYSNLQLMTIHKAKGLEFDSVILPGLARSTRANAKNLLMWREYLTSEHSGLLISPISAIGSPEDASYKHLYYEQGLASAMESTRLLYVACTRAIERLYLSFCLEDETKQPGKNTLMSSIWRSTKEQIQWHSVKVESEQLGLDFKTLPIRSQNLLRIGDQWKPPQWSFTNPLSDYFMKIPLASGGNRPEYINNHSDRLVGTVIHLVLEAFSTNGYSNWVQFGDEYRSKWIYQLLQSNGIQSEAIDNAVLEVIRQIEGVLSDKTGRWILSQEFSFAKSEFSLLGIDASGSASCKVIDRCFIDEKGDFWIIDFKTSVPHADESIEDHIQRESIDYSKQLEGYKKYIENRFQGHGYKKIRLALYFTNIPKLHEVI